MSIPAGVLPLARISAVTAAGLLFAATAVLALWGLWLLQSSSARRSELVARGGVELRRRRRLDEWLDAILVRTRRGEDLAGKLRSAGTELTPARFLLLVVGIAFAAFALLSLLFPVVLGVLGSVLAVWACFAWLARRLDRRREEFVSQLPDVARLLSNGASAGLSMPAAMELTVREIEAPASEELQTVIDELTFGRSLDESLASLQRRLPSREIAVLMTTLIIQQRSGGDVVRALQELSATLETRRETLREVRTVLAGVVFTSYVVPVIGLGCLFLLDLINKNTLHQMTTKPAGIVVLVIVGGLYTVGQVAIRRVTKVEI